jgi:hypothetical protein
MLNPSKYISITLVAFFCINLGAQDLPSGNVEIVKSFDARLEETDKINARPSEIHTQRSDRRFSYLLLPSEVKLDYKAPEIRPLAMSSEKLPEYYKGFLKAGFGYPLSPYAEAGYNLLIGDNLDILAHFRHHSANDKSVENQRFMDNDFFARATYYLTNGHAVSAKMNYSLDDVYFYGYNQNDTSFAKQYAQRRFNTFDGGASFYNTESTNNDLSYYANMDFYRHSDNYDGVETGTLIKLGVKKFLGGKHPIFADVITDLSTYTDTATQRLNNFFFVPGAAFNSEVFSLRGAVRISSFNDEFFFFPDVKAQLNIASGKLSIMAGWDGNFHKNSFRNLTTYNPFLRPVIPEINNAKYFDYYGGLSGVIGEYNYELRGGYKTVENMALFLVDYEVPRQFLTLYDTVNMIYVKAGLQTRIMEQVSIGLSATYNRFDPKNQEAAWHIPELEGNLSIVYNTKNEKLRLKTEIYYMNGINYLSEENTKERLNTLFDLSIGVDYMISQKFGLFFNLNNLASNRWRRWYDYPTYGINVLGGFMLKF